MGVAGAAAQYRKPPAVSVAVVIPYRPGDQWRARARGWLLNRLETAYPSWPVVFGASPDGPFNRSAAILDGAAQTDATVLVVTDADVWCDGVPAAVGAVLRGPHRWARPHRLIHRLSPESTAKVLTGSDWRGLPLSGDNRQDAKPYKGNDTGTLFVIARDTLEVVPPDVRFVGWGQEDQAHGIALNGLIGEPWRGPADLVHLWHPAPERLNRVAGSDDNVALLRRYQAARRRRPELEAIVAEARHAAEKVNA